MKKTGLNRMSRTWKMAALFAGQAMLLGSGGSCLPDNVLAETLGDVVNGLIVAGVNVVLSSTTVQI